MSSEERNQSFIETVRKITSPRIPVEVKEIPKQDFEDLTVRRVEKRVVPQTLVEVDKDIASGTIDSSVVGDTVMLLGEYGKIFEVTKITIFRKTGTTQTFKVKRQSRPAFTTEADISADNSSDKESDGGTVVKFGSRLVIEVTGAIASSEIDFSISYKISIPVHN